MKPIKPSRTSRPLSSRPLKSLNRRTTLKDLYPYMRMGETPIELSTNTEIIFNSQSVGFTNAVIQSARLHLKFADHTPKVVIRSDARDQQELEELTQQELEELTQETLKMSISHSV